MHLLRSKVTADGQIHSFCLCFQLPKAINYALMFCNRSTEQFFLLILLALLSLSTMREGVDGSDGSDGMVQSTAHARYIHI